MTQKGPAPGHFIISMKELTPSLASGQTLLRRAPSHLPGSTTADAWRSPWESHPHRLGKPAARQLSPQPGPLLCVSREGKQSKETCFGSPWCGFKSKPQHSLDVFSGEVISFSSPSNESQCPHPGHSDPTDSLISLHHTYPGLLSAPRCPLGKRGPVLGNRGPQLPPLYVLLPPAWGPKERTHSSPTGPGDLCSTGRPLGSEMVRWSGNRQPGLHQPLP